MDQYTFALFGVEVEPDFVRGNESILESKNHNQKLYTEEIQQIGAGEDKIQHDTPVTQREITKRQILYRAYPRLTEALPEVDPIPWSLQIQQQVGAVSAVEDMNVLSNDQTRWLHLTSVSMVDHVPKKNETSNVLIIASERTKVVDISQQKTTDSDNHSSDSNDVEMKEANGKRPVSDMSVSSSSPPSSPVPKRKKYKVPTPKHIPVQWILTAMVGQHEEQELTRICPEKGICSMNLDIYVPLSVSAISTPLRFWLRRFPQNLFATKIESDDWKVEVKLKGELTRYVPGERRSLEEHILRTKILVEQQERVHEMREQLPIWLARHEDEEDRANRKQLEPWLKALGSDETSHTVESVLVFLRDHADDYLLVLDPKWLSDGRAHPTSKAAWLIRTLFDPYSDVSRRILKLHKLYCKLMVRLHANGDELTFDVVYHIHALKDHTSVSNSDNNDDENHARSLFQSGMPEGVVSMALAAAQNRGGVAAM